MTSDEPAVRLMDKVRTFVASLDDAERKLFAALLAPGIAMATQPADDEVEGFGLTQWLPSQLPDALAAVVRDRDVRIEGL